MQEFKSVVPEKYELEYQDNPTRVALLPLLVIQDYNFDVKTFPMLCKNKQSPSSERVSIENLMEKRSK